MTTTFSRETPSQEDLQIFAASFAQQHAWILYQLEPESAINNISATVHSRRPFTTTVLERSLNALVQRHEALRTTFHMLEGQAVQVIAPTLTVPLPLVDLRSLPEAEREAQALRLAIEEARRPFDLTQGPLLRATLLHLGSEEDVLLLAVHYIVSDGWSLGVLLRELATLYESFSTGQSSPLPQLPMQFADFAARQQKWLRGDTVADELAYWKQQLAGSPAGLDLPTDRPRLPLPTWRGATYGLLLPKALTDDLKELSRRQRVTLYMTLVAAFQTLLYRYTRQEDVVLGTVTPGRTRAETEALIGLFENTLVLRADLSGNPTFRELLGRVREVILEAQAHQELPFEYLAQLQPKRQLGQNPLFQVSLTFEPPLPSLPSGWTLTQTQVETGTAKFDLSLDLEDRPEGLISRFKYSTDLFDESTIARMAGHWQTLLEAVVADSSQRLSQVSLLTERERHQLLVEWNDTAMEYPREQCLHQLFEAQVEQTPDAVAVVFEDDHLTYRELNIRANQLAHYLRQLGVGPEVLVGICVERSLAMVVGLLGILKAGGAYVPLDPTYPPDRLAFMLEDAQVTVLLTQQRLIEKLPRHEAKLVCLDTGWGAITQESEENVANSITGENLAYMLYTSGSTGKPKGVLATHRATINRFNWMWRTYPFEPGEVCCQKTTLSFVDSIWEIFGPLLQGIQIVIIPDMVVKDPQQLLQTLATCSVTRIVLVPSLLRILLDSRVDLQNQIPNLKYWIISGEDLPLELAQSFLNRMPHNILLNLYGSSEVAADVTCYEVGNSKSLTYIPIGRPIANSQIYLLDAFLQPVPIGVTGELYVSGAALARGYFNRPELTVERFIPNHFSKEPGACLYRTGDLARYLPDGNIEYLGRLDHQVKIRGFRIELGEIEVVLAQHPAIKEVVVVAREDVPGDKRLVGYIVLHKDQITTVDDLKSHVMKQVPAYMVPSAFVLLEALPLTPNGKVHRRALPAPDPSTRTVENTYAPPTLPLHQQLVQIWEDLLGVRPIGIRDDFFSLGGHSLLAVRLFDRVAHVCGKKLPLSVLFVGATIEHLVTALLEEEAKTDSRAPLVAAQTGGSRRPFFYLHGQWRGDALYSLELARHLGPDQPFYLLEPYKFEDLSVPPSFEAMAAAHIESLRSIQPEGPYLLGGWCNGGLVAYEMARQLHAQGQTVDLLVLMDPDSPAPYKWERRIIIGLGNLLRLSQEKQVDWFLSYRYLRLSFYYWRLNKLKHMKTTKQDGPELKRSAVDSIPPQLNAVIQRKEVLRRDWVSIYDWVASGYMPVLYPGKITFFWTDEEPFRRERWRKLNVVNTEGNEVEIHIIPGNHITSRTRYLSVLTEHLRLCISKAQSTLLS